MKRVCIDLTPFEMFDRHGGVARYGAHLLAGLVEIQAADPGRVEFCAMTFAHRPPVPAREALGWIRDPGAPVSKRAHRRRRRWRMGGQMKRAGVDLFHAIEPNTLPIHRPFITVVACHDLIPIVWPAGRLRPRELHKRRAEAGRSFLDVDFVVASSMASRNDLVAQIEVDPARIEVVHLGVDRETFAASDACPGERPVRKLPEPYFISVGSDHYRKNQERLAEAWLTVADRIPEGLVLVGRSLYEDTFSKIRDRVVRSGGADRFRWLADVSDDELPALYRGASAAVAPSLYEGFGMTLLEAMACGAPVVACDNPAYAEVAEDAALYFDGESVEDIGAKLVRISEESALRRTLIERGYRRADRLTWAETARRTWAVYEKLLWP